MAKQTGLGDQLLVSGRNISGDTQQLGAISGRVSPLDVTGIDKSAFERIHGLRDGQITYTAFFNPSIGQVHELLKTLPTADVPVAYSRGTALGAPTAVLLAKQVNYDPTRGTDGAMTFAVDAQANATALEWADLHTPGVRTDTVATLGTGVDSWTGAATAFGLQAWLQVLGFTGTSAVVKLQDSADNGGTDPYADVAGAAFTAVTTAPGYQRIETGRTAALKRWVRVVSTGTFSNLQFSVAVTRNQALTAVT